MNRLSGPSRFPLLQAWLPFPGCLKRKTQEKGWQKIGPEWRAKTLGLEQNGEVGKGCLLPAMGPLALSRLSCEPLLPGRREASAQERHAGAYRHHLSVFLC